VDPATGAVDAAATALRRQAVGADDGREPGG
jgi:hypothetical protein